MSESKYHVSKGLLNVKLVPNRLPLLESHYQC